jgi:hypothetical protein
VPFVCDGECACNQGGYKYPDVTFPMRFCNAQAGQLVASGHPCALTMLLDDTSPPEFNTPGTYTSADGGCAPEPALSGPRLAWWPVPDAGLHAAFTLSALANLAAAAAVDVRNRRVHGA